MVMAAPVVIALMVASAAASAYGAIQAGNAQKAAADRQAQIDRQNADLASQDRINAIKTAQLKQEDLNRSNRVQLAAIRNAYGNSGIDLAGSPLDVLADTSTSMALDSARVGYEGEVQGRSKAIQILGLQNDANTAEAAGRQAQTAGYITAGTDLLSGAAKAASFGASGGGGGGGGGGPSGNGSGSNISGNDN